MNLPPFTALSCPLFRNVHHCKVKHLQKAVVCREYTFVFSDFTKLSIKTFLCKNEFPDTLVLGAGGCCVCKRCGAADNIPCRFPDKAVAALESYSINVSKLASACDMKYINGVNTVTYFGGVLY